MPARMLADMRKIAGIALALMTVGLLAGCVTVTAPPQVIATGGIATAVPVPKPKATDVTCPNGKLELTKSNTSYRLDKSCVVVKVPGSSITISAGTITTLIVTGKFDSIGANSVATLTIDGDNDTVTAPTIGGTSIKGFYNEVSAAVSLGTLTIDGTSNTVTSPKTGKVTQTGTDNKVSAGT